MTKLDLSYGVTHNEHRDLNLRRPLTDEPMQLRPSSRAHYTPDGPHGSIGYTTPTRRVS